jgi:rubrerythrin
MKATHDMKEFFRQLVENPVQHARVLNTFSYLEYIGFRKIIKSQPANRMTLQVLAHAGEEARHAMILKKMALRLTSSLSATAKDDSAVLTYAETDISSGQAASDYFQQLDRYVADDLARAVLTSECGELTYFYVTWLIEIRALSVYSDYVSVVSADGSSTALEGLIAEEDRHLEYVTERLSARDPDFSKRSEKLKAVEHELFQQFFQSLIQDSDRAQNPRIDEAKDIVQIPSTDKGSQRVGDLH